MLRITIAAPGWWRDLAGGLHAVKAGHADIEHHDVGRGSVEDIQRLAAVRGLTA